MRLLGKKLAGSPAASRVAPFLIFLALTVCQGKFGAASVYWFYLAKTIAGAWLVWAMRPLVSEMRWAFSWEAVVAGIGVYVIWVGLDPYYPKIEFLFKAGNPWNPFKQFGEASAMGWFFVAVRTIGSALVVPPIEEAFYRSFLYRYFIRLDFQNLPFNQLHWLSLIVTSLLFGLAHYQWLGGVLCGLIFQSLVLRKNRLGDAMTAHAITNFLLGIWIVWKGDWKFW